MSTSMTSVWIFFKRTRKNVPKTLIWIFLAKIVIKRKTYEFLVLCGIAFSRLQRFCRLTANATSEHLRKMRPRLARSSSFSLLFSSSRCAALFQTENVCFELASTRFSFQVLGIGNTRQSDLAGKWKIRLFSAKNMLSRKSIVLFVSQGSFVYAMLSRHWRKRGHL